MESLLLKSLEDQADIIVWPEVSVPSYLATNVNDRLFFHNRIMDNDAFLILGIPESRFNSRFNRFIPRLTRFSRRFSRFRRCIIR